MANGREIVPDVRRIGTQEKRERFSAQPSRIIHSHITIRVRVIAMKKIVAVGLLGLILSGCGGNLLKTMVAHTTIDNKAVYEIAMANAATNVCVAEKAVDRQRAFEFSTIAAQFLDLVVFDQSYYKQVYDQQLQSFGASRNSSDCNKLENELPRMTTFLHENYNRIAANLGQRRAEENRQMMESISSFRANSTYSSPQAAFPPLQFRQEQPATQNYLVNTKRGLVQCRVTNNNFVFCL